MLSLRDIEASDGYSVIYADPPWRYDDRCNGAAAKHYSTMTLEEVCALPVARLAARDCALFLWATFPMLREALATIEAWGFDYKSIAFAWVKTYQSGTPFFGLGRWTRGNVEPCLLAIRGRPQRTAMDVSQLVFSPAPDHEQPCACVQCSDHLVVAPVGRHSAKPPEARQKIERLMGVSDDVPALELFARERIPGWDAWGRDEALDAAGGPTISLEAP